MKPTRKQTTVRLPEGLLADLHSEARRQGISVSRLIEEITEHHLYQPNDCTAAAVEEARSGQPMEEISGEALESFEKFEEYVSRSGT